MASITPLRDGKWRARIRRKGYPKLDKVFNDENAAKHWAEATETALTRSGRAEPGQASAMVIAELLELYKASTAFTRKAASTRKRELVAHAEVLRSFGAAGVEKLTVPLLQRWIDRRGAQVKPDTVRLEKAALSAVLKFGITRGYCQNNPAKGGLELPERHPREVRISPQQEQALRQAAEVYLQDKRALPALRTWLMLLLETGMRPGEAARLRWAQFHADKRQFRIRRDTVKNKQPRVVLLSDDLTDWLKAEQERQGGRTAFVCPSRDGKKGYDYGKVWQKLRTRAKLPKEIVAHAGRHEFISQLFEHGAGLSTGQIAELAGDVDEASLRPYKHLRTEILRAPLETVRAAVKAERKKALEDGEGQEENGAGNLTKEAGGEEGGGEQAEKAP